MKDAFYGKLAFYLSLGFWVPLFNIGFTAVSIFYAIRSLKLIKAHPKKVGGFWYSLIGLIISVSALVTTIVFLSVYAWRQITCETSFG